LNTEVLKAMREKGIILRYFADKGFGFVGLDNGQDVFFHISQCQAAEGDLQPGMAVEFRRIADHNKPDCERAVDVALV
jgi:cold shock CspA family protein